MCLPSLMRKCQKLITELIPVIKIRPLNCGIGLETQMCVAEICYNFLVSMDLTWHQSLIAIF